jgi:hypothetical protein
VIEHSPRRSNLLLINAGRHAVVEIAGVNAANSPHGGILRPDAAGHFPGVVGAPFPLAGRAGGWVGQHCGFMVLGPPFLGWSHAGILKASPLTSMAQAMRAFFAAIATTAFQ